MHRKYNLNLFLVRMTATLLAADFIAADFLKKLAEITLIGNLNKKGTSREEIIDISSTGHFFQDIFSEHLTPSQIEFGHVYENPIEWEQRFESKDFVNNHHSGKIKWGNQRGEYGEHYWDLNH